MTDNVTGDNYSFLVVLTLARSSTETTGGVASCRRRSVQMSYVNTAGAEAYVT